MMHPPRFPLWLPPQPISVRRGGLRFSFQVSGFAAPAAPLVTRHTSLVTGGTAAGGTAAPPAPNAPRDCYATLS